VLCGLLLVIFVEPSSRFFAAGRPISKDRRPTYLAIGLIGIYLVLLIVPSLGSFFDITPLSLKEFAWVVAAVAAWAILIRWIWRWRVVDRFLSIDLKGQS
jgi:cation-transporting ATPase E